MFLNGSDGDASGEGEGGGRGGGVVVAAPLFAPCSMVGVGLILRVNGKNAKYKVTHQVVLKVLVDIKMKIVFFVLTRYRDILVLSLLLKR